MRLKVMGYRWHCAENHDVLHNPVEPQLSNTHCESYALLNAPNTIEGIAQYAENITDESFLYGSTSYIMGQLGQHCT